MKLTRRAVSTMLATSGISLSAAAVAIRRGLIPPDHAGFSGIGETLNYASQRALMAVHSHAPEFDRSAIDPEPYVNGNPLSSPEYQHQQESLFADWRLKVEGLVEQPLELSLHDLTRLPFSRQITQLACEEGWSFIAEWTGTPLATVLDLARVRPEARYAVYFSLEREWWDSIDLAEARHPQTLLTYAMNGIALPPEHGGPLRMRTPRQLGYKSVKYINRIVLTKDLSRFGKGLGSSSPEQGFAWYAGI